MNIFGEPDPKPDDSYSLMKVMGSSESVSWETPENWFKYLDLEFGFDLDPCCTKESAKTYSFFTEEDDGLKQPWKERRVFMNPPYGREIIHWMKKAYEECRDNKALVVCLVPARVETEWWHRYAAKGEVRFPVGRLKFSNAEFNAPFPVAIVIFRPKL